MLEEPEGADWPDARDVYRSAYELGKRASREGTARSPFGAARELARLRSWLPLRGLGPAAEATIRVAIERGEADGRAGVEPRW